MHAAPVATVAESARLFVALLLCAPAVLASSPRDDRLHLAQVSGEILVGRTAGALVADSPSVTGEFAEPQPVVMPQPLYPRAARAARQEGRVVVCFTIDETGMVRQPAVRASSAEVFNEPALTAITAARFTPAKAGSRAVRSTACRTFRFLLR